MPNKILDTVDTNGDSNAPQQPLTPPLPPSVERYEDGEGGDGKGDSLNIGKHTTNPKHWTAYVEAACAVLLVLITATYTYYSAQQTSATITAAKAAKSAAETAEHSLELTRQQFASSEAAVLQPNVSIHNLGNGAFIQIDIINSGHIAATHVSGVIAVPHHPLVHLINDVVTTHSASPEYQSGFITRTVGLSDSPDLKALAAQHLRVSGELNYWNGIEQIRSKFCYGLTISPYTNAPDWQDCENQESFQQTLR